MIVRPRPNWMRMLFVWRGSILKNILPQLLFTTALSVAVVYFHGELLHWKVTLTAVPFSLVGVALAIFLGFRNNASYDRYWEARKLWGKLLTDSRNAARQCQAYMSGDPQAFVHGIAAFAYASRDQLRGTALSDDAKRLLPPALVSQIIDTPNPALHILQWLSQAIRDDVKQGHLSPVLAAQLDHSLCGLNDALGGCERIANTPLPFTYSVILHRTVYLYCLMLPFGLLDSIGIMTPLMVAFVAYTFFAIEALSDEIEEPFGHQPNDLALDAMSTTIERHVRQMLGDTDLPPTPQPDNYLLS